MARSGIRNHRKFKRLQKELPKIPAPYLVGLLQTMWECGYEAGDPLLGAEEDVELAAEWPGKPGALFRALKIAEFIEDSPRGGFQIHDLYDHAPDYVKKRIARKGLAPQNKDLGEKTADERREVTPSSRQTAQNGGPHTQLTHSLTPHTQHSAHTPPPQGAAKPESGEEELAIAREWLRREGVREEELGLYAGIRHFGSGPLDAVAIAVGNADYVKPKNRLAYIEHCLSDLPKLRLQPKARKGIPPKPPDESAVVDAEKAKIDAELAKLTKSDFDLHRAAVEAAWSGPKTEDLVRLRIYQRVTKRVGAGDARASPQAAAANG